MAIKKLKKGYDLKLKGGITNEAITIAPRPTECAIIPDDFEGIIPRMEKKEGEHVQAGEALYHDKTHECIVVTSPISGTVKAIVRGERRKIEKIIIEADQANEYKTFNLNDTKSALLESGLWAMLRQRPYDVVPTPEATPRDIFVTCFDSAPLAPDLTLINADKAQYLQKGVDVLKTITGGNVYLGCREGHGIELNGAETVVFKGPHPAGNAGIQVANIKPVNKGEVVWTTDVVTLARIGELFSTGKVNYDTIVAITGQQVEQPCYVKTVMGAPLSTLLEGKLCDNGKTPRIISGNVLTGYHVMADEYLRAPYRHITVIPELQKEDEFMGWASLSPKKFSVYRNFTGWLLGMNRKEMNVDARMNGGERAIVMSGEYDRMLPMDIYAEFLIKAIIAFDIDKMEQLGIYEVAPEDFALCEFADTSKLELQRIVRDGLNRLRKEMS